MASRNPNRVIYRDDDIVKFELTQGKVVMVDTELYHLLTDYSWHAVSTKRMSRWYAKTDICVDGKFRGLPMHRLIINAPRDVSVDHVNGNGLDNRLSNLRLCTNQQNICNSAIRKDNSSGYKGVHRRYNGLYQARIIRNGARISLGHYDDPCLAAHIYDAAAKYFYGEFAKVNFENE